MLSNTALSRSVIPAVNESGGGWFHTRNVPRLWRTSTCDDPDLSRQNRSVAWPHVGFQ
jgi:hypothetical protein